MSEKQKYGQIGKCSEHDSFFLKCLKEEDIQEEIFFFFWKKDLLFIKLFFTVIIYVQMLGNKPSVGINLCSLAENRVCMLTYNSGDYGPKNRDKIWDEDLVRKGKYSVMKKKNVKNHYV